MGTEGIADKFLNFFELIKWLLLAALFLTVFVVLVGTPLPVSGMSMEPNFHDHELVVIERLSYLNDEPIKRGDVVAARFPADPGKTKLIKRVVGLPGETVSVSEGKISINGAPLNEPYLTKGGTPPYTEISSVTLKDNEYFLTGDNRPGSSDSRLWGPVQRADIQGRVAFIIFPFGKASYISRIDY